MTTGDAVTVVASTAAFAWLGGIGAGPVGAAIGAAAGAAAGWGAVRAGVRPIVGGPVLVGTAAGAVAGRSIVHALCLPGSCPGLEWTAASLTGLGSLVGIGLLVALVVRSFDEYRAARDEDRPPPTTGCGPGGSRDDPPA